MYKSWPFIPFVRFQLRLTRDGKAGLSVWDWSGRQNSAPEPTLTVAKSLFIAARVAVEEEEGGGASPRLSSNCLKTAAAFGCTLAATYVPLR